MKRILVITYYWPPAGGGGVQRVAKFCKYLPDFGYEPVVLTVKDGNYDATDTSLNADVRGVQHVVKARTLEPHALYRGLQQLLGLRKTGAKGGSAPGRASQVRQFGEFVRLNAFIPDSRIGWKPHAVRAGAAMIRDLRPVAIFSSAPPYTVHLVAKALHERFSLPWVCDFRDPWMENHAYNTAHRFGWVKARNRKLEASVLSAADAVTSANPRLGNILSTKLGESHQEKFHVITNGYDSSDVRTLAEDDGRFRIGYFGTIYGKGFPLSLLDAIARLIREVPEPQRICFEITGTVHPAVLPQIEARIPAANLAISGWIPHSDMLQRLYRPQVLPLVVNEFPHNDATVPGKFFELVPTGNPLLGIGPLPGDLADLIEASQTGNLCAPQDTDGIFSFLLRQFRAWENGALSSGTRTLTRFQRRNLAGDLARVFESVL